MINLHVIFRDDYPDGDKLALHKKDTKKKRKPRVSEVNLKLIDCC